jgi:DNA-binding transcriptional LysR family regulator
MDFTLRQLEALIAVARRGSLNAAADDLQISQVAASGLVKALESALNVSLLLRNRGKKAVITPEGNVVLPLAEKIVEAAGQLRRTTDRLNGSQVVREIRIGARSILIDRWLRDIVAQFQKDRPLCDVRLIRGSNEDIFAQLAEQHIFLGIFMQNELLPAMPCRKLGSWPVSLYVSHAHPLTNKTEPGLEEINAFGFIAPPSGTSAEKSIRDRLNRAGFGSVHVVARAEYAESLKLMTMAGAGIGVLFDDDACPEVENGRLVRLAVQLQQVDVWMAVSDQAPEEERSLADFVSAQFRLLHQNPF